MRVSGPRLKLLYALISKLDGCSDHRFCYYTQFVFNQNWITIRSRFPHPLSGLKSIFNNFCVQKFYKYQILPIRGVWDYFFKSAQKMDRDNLDLLEKSKTSGHCGFPLANLHSGESVDFVPESNQVNKLILLYICSTNPQFFRWIKLSRNSREPWISRHYFIHVSKWYLRWKSSEGDANRLERYRADGASQWSVAEFG